jgi:hypothetical protein
MEHDEEIHQATLRLRSWLRSEIERKLMPPAISECPGDPFAKEHFGLWRDELRLRREAA